jgi:hypothetical protein
MGRTLASNGSGAAAAPRGYRPPGSHGLTIAAGTDLRPRSRCGAKRCLRRCSIEPEWRALWNSVAMGCRACRPQRARWELGDRMPVEGGEDPHPGAQLSFTDTDGHRPGPHLVGADPAAVRRAAGGKPKTLRHRPWRVAARIVRHARRLIVPLQRTWPRASALAAAFTRLRALPLRCWRREPRLAACPQRPRRPTYQLPVATTITLNPPTQSWWQRAHRSRPSATPSTAPRALHEAEASRSQVRGPATGMGRGLLALSSQLDSVVGDGEALAVL